MKKKVLSLLLAITLMVSLSLTLGVAVSAEDGDDSRDVDLIGTVNSFCSFFVNERCGHQILRLTDLAWGSYPPGMYTRLTEDGRFYLEGTPTQIGEWRISQNVEVCEFDNPSETWEEGFNIHITVEGAPEPPVITKHPTGENVAENGWTEFIAYANGAKNIRWVLVNQSNGQAVNASDAPTYFPGVKVTGASACELIFENVPLTMNNWAAQCAFSNEYGETMTAGALIRVFKTELKVPEIKSQSKDVELDYGANTVLKVDAVSPDGNTLMYQWYKNIHPSRNGGDAIYGAYGATFTANYEPGTAYYYCVIRNSKNGETSQPVATELIAVTGKPAPTATPAPTAEPTTVPSASPTDAPTATPAATEAPAPASNGSTMIILVVALAVAVVALGVALAAVMGKSRRK